MQGATYWMDDWRGLGMISIHAPAQGATKIWRGLCSSIHISIHAPAQGATYGRKSSPNLSKFQSTLPHRERPKVETYFWRDMDFYPRSRTGSDTALTRLLQRHRLFLSTLPHRERRSTVTVFRIIYFLFQSTLPHRERLSACDQTKLDKWFQSTLPHRERPGKLLSCWYLRLFQSTLPHRERRYLRMLPRPGATISIHAPAQGATPCDFET